MVLGPDARGAGPGSDGRGEDPESAGSLLNLDLLDKGSDHAKHDGEDDRGPEGGHHNACAERGDEHDDGD